MKQKDVLFLLIPAALVVLAWIIFSIYHNAATSTISPTLKTNILPISPDFDTETISNLKARENIEPIYEIEIPDTPTPTLTALPTLAPTPTITPSPSIAEQTPTPEPSITP